MSALLVILIVAVVIVLVIIGLKLGSAIDRAYREERRRR